MPDEPIDVPALARRVLRESDATDPAALADQVAAQVPTERAPEALRSVLVEFVRMMIGRERTAARPARSMQERPTNVGTSRAALVRGGWQRALRDRVHVAAGTFKFLADCTVDDLTFAEGELSEMAARTAAKAEFYSTLRKLLEHHDVERVEELPGDVLADFLTGAAA